MIFALSEIAITITWHVSTYALRLIYNGLYYLYYGTYALNEDISRKELEEKIHCLEEKVDKMNETSESEADE